jgi:hypothetical protein
MKLRAMSDRAVTRLVEGLFGPGIPHDRKGSHCLVHLDAPGDEERARRNEGFDPSEFFDAGCPHCQPFLADGAIMVFDGPEVVGLRMLAGGMFESVCKLGAGPATSKKKSYVM